MVLVRNTMLLPGGAPVPMHVTGKARVQLINGGFAVTGAPEEAEILGQFYVQVDQQGHWEIDLIPNELIDPEGTYYRVEETAGRVGATHHFIVPRFVDVVSASRTSNVVTAVLETADHGIRVGDSVVVDLSDNTYDGTFTVTEVSGAQIKWNQVAANDPSGGTGTVNKTIWDLYDLLIDQPPGVVVTVAAPASVLGSVASHPALARWRQRLARSRAAGNASSILFIGDSITEGIGISSGNYRNRFIERLRRRFAGQLVPGSMFLPVSNNIFDVIGDGAWPGGDDPWTFTGNVTGDLSRGVSWHAATVPTTGTAAMPWFGAFAFIIHSKIVSGASAAVVTIDGVASTALDGEADPDEANGVTYLASADGYGHHTVVIDPNDGPLVLEGFFPLDAGEFFFVPINTTLIYDGGHSGYQASVWGGAGVGIFPGNDQWTNSPIASDSLLGLIVVLLGVNDQGSVSPGQFEDNLVGIVNRYDARAGHSDMGFLFVAVPGVPSTLANAMAAAAVRVGANRAVSLDLAALRPNRTFGTDLSGDGTHPNDAGNVWMAEMLGNVLDPESPGQPPKTPDRIQIDANDLPAFRSNWTEATTPVSGSALVYDEAGASAVRERRHRIWLDAGTYRADVTCEHAAGRGTFEFLAGRWNSNTPTLTSLGTVDTSVGTGVTTTELATTFQTSNPSWVPFYIRKTNQANIARFVQATIHKIG